MRKLPEINISVPEPTVIVNNNDPIWPSAVGAFLGAFFAFIFGLIAYYVQKKLERYWKHKNAIVEIEHLLNDHLNNSSGNQYLLSEAIKTLTRKNMSYTLLTQLRVPVDIDLRIGDLDVINRYEDYREPLEKVNHGLTAWQGMNEHLQQSIIANPNLPGPIVHKNMQHIREQADALIKFLKGLDEDNKRLLAYIRIYLRKDKHIWSTWYLKKIKYKDKPLITEKEIEIELKSFEKEVKELSKKSRERIKKIIGS